MQLKAILIAAGFCTAALAAQDQISIEAHLSAPNGPVTRFIPTRHYSSTWVYVEGAPGKGTTVLDITHPDHPKVVSEITSGTLLSVNGTTALATDASADQPRATAPQTIRIMDFADPAHPKVTRQFDGVTAIQQLSNGLILLANPEGIWILHERRAQDPEEEKRYARKVIYGDSMY